MKICSPTWRRFSTVEVLEEGIPGSKHKIFFLTMPEIMEAKNGKVNKWLKKEGEAFAAKESICEVSCSGISIGFSSDKAGILIQRLVNEGQIVDIRKPIASYVLHKEAHMSYIESKHMQAAEEARMQHHEEMVDEDEQSDKKPDAMVLMREIKHLIQQGQIQEGSDFAKQLQSLARREDNELMDVFIASFDGIAFSRETFDSNFFLSHAKKLVDENKN
eukprot:gene5616-6184_t